MTAGVAALIGIPQIDAQDIAAEPRGGLFGATSSSASRTNLDLNVAVSQAYDSQPPPELFSRIRPGTPQSGGFSSMLIGSSDYVKKSPGFDLHGSAATAARYYQRLDQVSMVTGNAALGGMFRLASRTTLDVTQDAAYSPSYLYQLFPTVLPPEVGQSISAAPDYRVEETQSYSFDTRVKLSAGSPRQNRVELRAERNFTNFTERAQRPDLDVVGGAAKWAHGVGRTGSLFAEYEFRRGEFGFGARTNDQRMRIGGEWSPALSRTRRASFHFAVAPSMIEIPASATNVIATGALFRVEGDVSVTYPFFRSWSAAGVYRRGVEYVAVLRDPAFRDAVRLELSGLVTDRVDVLATAGSSAGESALAQASQRYDAYTGTVRARYTVARSLALYGEYLYYYYRFHDLAGLAVGLPNRFEQHSLRAGLMLWARPVGR
jgi:hypothetical protein